MAETAKDQKTKGAEATTIRPIRSDLSLFDPKEVPPDAKVFSSGGIPDVWQAGRDRLLRTVPNRDDGLDLQRVEAHIQSLGIPLGDYAIFDREDTPGIKSLLPGFDHQIFPTGYHAVYLPQLALALVERRRELETLNDPVISEGILVHELVHNSNQHVPRVYRRAGPGNWGVDTPRIGVALMMTTGIERGNFIEEGFCDCVRGRYLNSHLDSAHSERILAGAGDAMSGDAIHKYDPETGISYYIPVQFLEVKKDGSVSYSISAIAGVAMELMCRREPTLFQALCDARQDMDALRAIPGIVNSMDAGLYSVLRQLRYNETDFTVGLRIVCDRLYGGRQPSL